MSFDVVIYGAGGMAREIYEWSFVNGDSSSIGNLVGYYSDLGTSHDFEKLTGLPFVDLRDALEKYPNLRILICIGEPSSRKSVAQKLSSLRVKMLTFIHPSAIVAKSAQIGSGSVIYPYVVVSSNAVIGENCVVNSYTGVGHDVVIGPSSVISAQVDLTGYVNLGECVFIGSGARVLPKKKIGSFSKISAGITVIRSLGANSIVLPRPTKIEK